MSAPFTTLYDKQKDESKKLYPTGRSPIPDQISLSKIAADINTAYDNVFNQALQGDSAQDLKFLNHLSIITKRCRELSLISEVKVLDQVFQRSNKKPKLR